MDEIKLKSPFNAKNPRVASVFSSMADQMNYKCLLIQKHIKIPDKIKYLKNNDRTVKRIRKFIRGQKMPPKSKNPKSLQKVLKFKVFLGKPAHLWLPRSSNIIGLPRRQESGSVPNGKSNMSLSHKARSPKLSFEHQ